MIRCQKGRKASTNKGRVWTGFLSLFFALPLLFGGADLHAADKVVFILDWIPYGSHTGFYTAHGRGIFREANLDVTIRRGYGSGDTVKNITAGNGDFGFADTGTLIVARDKGAKVKSVGVLYNRAPHTAFALKRSGIRSVKDLGGRSIGDAQGGAAYAIFPALAKLHGIKDWKFIPMSPASKNPALLAGKVDVIVTFADVGPALRAGAMKTKNEIVELRYADNGLDFHGNGIVVQEKDITGRADLVRRFVNAAFRGVAYAINHRDEGAGLFAKANPNANPELIRRQWDVLVSLAWTDETRQQGIGHLSPKKMQDTIDLLTKYRGLKSKQTVEGVYAPQFLEKILP